MVPDWAALVKDSHVATIVQLLNGDAPRADWAVCDPCKDLSVLRQVLVAEPGLTQKALGHICDGVFEDYPEAVECLIDAVATNLKLAMAPAISADPEGYIRAAGSVLKYINRLKGVPADGARDRAHYRGRCCHAPRPRGPRTGLRRSVASAPSADESKP